MKVGIKNIRPGGMEKREGRIARFVRRHRENVCGGGLPGLLRTCQELLVLALGLPGALLIRALRPFILIRLGQLISQRIGHFAANTEMYLCRRDAGLDNRRTLDIFYTAPFISNQQLKRMWARSLHICTFAGLVDKANRSLPGREKHSIQIFFTGADRDIHGLLAHSRPHLSFTDGEERRGLTALQQIGIPDDSRFICFCARDSAYLHDTSPVRDLRYHDYRDSNIENYIPAAEEMTHRGYVAMRMGAIVKKALTTTNPMVIDYANKYRSDFLDIFLSAKCYFFICDTNGLHAIPKVFRRPIAYVNIIPLEHAPTGSPDDLFIPKRLWQRGERRFLTFRQMLDATANMLPTSEYFKTLGIESVENTPDEITALTIEMDERLKGTWQTTEEDEELQRRFWELFRRRELSKIFLSRIGAVFLRQNQASLE